MITVCRPPNAGPYREANVICAVDMDVALAAAALLREMQKLLRGDMLSELPVVLDARIEEAARAIEERAEATRAYYARKEAGG